jgi:hypothetical protein
VNLLDAALKYAESGFAVLPLHTIRDGGCSCSNTNCRSAGKHPLLPHGLKEASTDEYTIRGWWAKWPDANIGLRMGEAVVAVDVDRRHNGDRTWDALRSMYGELPETATQRTGNGWHYLFEVAPEILADIKGKLGEGVDLKANGYIVAEPSIHHSGNRYEWESGLSLLGGFLPARAPRWLEQLMVGTPQVGDRPIPVNEGSPKPVTLEQLGEAREALKYLNADDYETWIRHGMALHSTGLGEAAFQVWCEWASLSPKYDYQIQITRWTSFRFRPGGVSLSSTFAEAQAVGWKNPLAATSVPMVPKLVAAVPGFRVEPGSSFGDNFQPPEYAIDGLLLRGYLHGLTGLSNAGKTAIALAMAVSVATGKDFGGHRSQCGKVLFLAGENPEDLRLRIRGVEMYTGMHGKLNEMQVAFARFDLASNMQHLHNLAQEHGGFGLVVVDSSAAFFQGQDENSNTEMVRHALQMRRLTELAGRPAVVVICHPSKHAHGNEALMPRGGSAFLNELDANLTAWKEGEIVQLSWNKVRGPGFDPISIKLEVYTFEQLETNLGSKVTSIVATPVDQRTSEDLQKAAEVDEDAILALMEVNQNLSLRQMAQRLNWVGRNNQEQLWRVVKAIKQLEADHLVRKYRRKYVLVKGKK